MTNNYYAVKYKLFAIKDGETTLFEEATEQQPFTFISGFGITLPKFAKETENLNTGDKFDFTIDKAEAFGTYMKEHVIQLDKEALSMNGTFPEHIVYVGATIPLQNADGNKFMGRVLSISNDKVEIDLNHPLAGYDLQYQGEVLECHEATNEEIQSLINSMSGCGGGCHGGCHGDGGCDGGNCQGDGGCKGGCNEEGGCNCQHN